jgi:CheY-like chemotaxis protein
MPQNSAGNLLSYFCALAQRAPARLLQMSDVEATILLVDDDPVTLNVAARVLKISYPNVTLNVVTDGIAAYGYIQGTGEYADRLAHPHPQLILLDNNMPRLTGLEFLQWLREQAPEESRNIPVLMVSASDTASEKATARALGASHFFPKPIRWSDLCQTIESNRLLEPQARAEYYTLS